MSHCVQLKNNAKTVKLIFQRLYEKNPRPQTELKFNSPFELLIAVILSAQTTDIKVNKVTGNLFKIACTPENLISLGENKLKEHIKAIGLYNNKAKNIIATCNLLIAKFNNQIPKTQHELESLPGVGRKTANVFLNTILAQPVIGVDTHVFRVARRIGLSASNTPKIVEQDLYKIVPKKFWCHVHNLLVLHGRYICTAKKPKCNICPINNLCLRNFAT